MSPLPVGFPPEQGPDFQFGSLTSDDRQNICIQTTAFDQTGWAYAGYNRFQLTALGADLDIEADWSAGTFSLEKWRHITSTGRDQYVRVVHRGYLYPLGLKAVIINITERFLLQDPANPTGFSDAVLQQYQIIKVQQYTKSYPASGQPYPADWPYSQVTMKTIVTPPIIPLNVSWPGMTVEPAPVDMAQLVQIAYQSSGAEFQWTYVLTDENGTEAHVTGPLCFMSAGTGVFSWPSEYQDTPAAMGLIRDAYNNIPVKSRLGYLNGEHLKYAPEGQGKVGATTHPTYQITLEAATVTNDPVSGATPLASQPTSGPQSAGELQANLQPAFYPTLAQSVVKLPAAEGLSRGPFVDQASAGAPIPGISLQYYPPYVQAPDYSGNVGYVYMALTDAVGSFDNGPALKFPGDAVGGIGTPNIKAAGLSTTAGLVSGGLDTFAQSNQQKPTDYFPASLLGPEAPQLFGGLKLSDLITGGLTATSNPPAPLMSLPNIVNSVDPTSLSRTISYDLEVPLLPWPPPSSANGPVFIPQNYPTTAEATLNLHALVHIDPNGASTYVVNGTITPFTVNILGSSGGLNFIQIPFNRAEFTSQSGKKTDIKVLIGQVTFEGALSFVNALEQFLEDLGGSGFKINVTPTGITGGFGISLPDISIGMVDISGLAMSAAVDVPFLGQPATATFSFASKEKPFTVAVSMFGGSGYITLVLGLHQVQQVTAGINFGGNFELNLGVASGGIQLVAGILYNYSDSNGVQLTGYVKLSGGVTVLGFISVGVTLDLTLTYQENMGASWVTGSATLTLSVGIFCFHVSFGFTITKQFSGSGTPPPAVSPEMRRYNPDIVGPEQLGPPASVVPATFADLMTSQNWQQYCSTFSA